MASGPRKYAAELNLLRRFGFITSKSTGAYHTDPELLYMIHRQRLNRMPNAAARAQKIRQLNAAYRLYNVHQHRNEYAQARRIWRLSSRLSRYADVVDDMIRNDRRARESPTTVLSRASSRASTNNGSGWSLNPKNVARAMQKQKNLAALTRNRRPRDIANEASRARRTADMHDLSTHLAKAASNARRYI